MNFFVRSNSFPHYGVGKVIGEENGKVRVEYFDSPTTVNRKTILVDSSDCSRVQLYRQTRVYFLDAENGVWRVGRVDDLVDNVYLIRLPNKESQQIDEEDLYTRWAYPISDPCEHLAARLNETPYYHDGRLSILRRLVEQRAACRGMRGLLSAPISLEEHQVEVIQRVLGDPIQRYMLADEVGLGKTIEAGVILRQYILEHADDHSVLIVVPEALVGQWKEELSYRCQLGDDFGHTIQVLSYEDVVKFPFEDLESDFLIVDEAHQAVAGWNRGKDDFHRKLFERLRRLSKPSKLNGFLLLSATPIRGNEDGFLALLSLLDPHVYKLDDLDAFRRKVEKRQNLADLYYTFTEDQHSFFLEGNVEELGGLFPDDLRLKALLDQIRSVIEDDSEEGQCTRRRAIRAVRVHLGESYRLHRRLLRNRRSTDLEALLPGRAGLKSIPYDYPRLQVVEERLEAWRAEVASQYFDNNESEEAQTYNCIFQALLELMFYDLDILMDLLNARLKQVTAHKIEGADSVLPAWDEEQIVKYPHFEGEADFLRAILEDHPDLEDLNEERYDAIFEHVRDKVAESERVVLFCSLPETADVLCEYLRELIRVEVYRHTSEDDNWKSFVQTNAPSVLVCDYRAEEGLNLQGGKVNLFHVDLPTSPNRLEQRLGRVDRFGVGFSVQSFVMESRYCPFHEIWKTYLDKTYKVFDRSIAVLQYVVEDAMTSLRARLLTDGISAFEESMASLAGEGGVLEEELQAILKQDEFDSIEVLTNEEGGGVFEAIESLESNESDFQANFEFWVKGLLQFDVCREEKGSPHVVRYGYNKRRTLESVDDLLTRFGAAIDMDVDHRVYHGQLTHLLTYQRETSRRRNIGLARLGNSFIDGLHDYLLWDDRGSCFALWRECPLLKANETRIYFRFDYLLEIGKGSWEDIISKKPMLNMDSLLCRADAAFPPCMGSIWVGDDGSIPEGDLLAELIAAYKQDGDKNLNFKRWRQLHELEVVNLESWADSCYAARERADKEFPIVMNLDEKSRTLTEQLLVLTSIREEQIKCRIHALEKSSAEAQLALDELDLEASVRDLLLDGIKKPHIRLDAAGAVFLSGSAYPYLD